MKILDVGELFGFGVGHIFDPWKPIFPRWKKVKDAENLMPDMDLVCFGGGADIHPSIYGHNNNGTQCGPVVSFRDLFEIEIWKLARAFKKPIMGICRGSQFTCAMSSGTLIQDISGHAGINGHALKTNDGRDMFITSTHHQMMWPGNVEHELIAWTEGRSYQGYVFDIRRMPKPWPELGEKEPEIVYFPATHVLAIQGHPEYFDNVDDPPIKYTRELVMKYLGVNP